jgi:preprotein translocase subunit YajC
MLFASPAFAQSTGLGGGSGIASFVPLILIFAIMYFLLIRPQQKKVKQHQAMVKALRKGDQVVTGGGVIGKVTKVGAENEIEVEIATGVKVKVIQSTIQTVLNKTEPAK